MASLLLGSLSMASPSSFTTLSFSRSQSLAAFPLARSSSLSLSSSSSSNPNQSTLIYCGRGDKKTARGKRFNHSFGNARPRNKEKGRGPPRVPTPPLPYKRKDPFDDGEIIKIDFDDDVDDD